MRLVPHLFGLSLGSVLFACSSTPATTTTITRPELVAVSPDDFIGMQHCGDGPGLVGSYVATLFDVSITSDGGPTPEYGFPLPSSPATACEFPVTFSLVLVDHRYRAEIDAYDRVPQVKPPPQAPLMRDPNPRHITAVSVGGRLQQDGTGAHVAPRWTAICGGYRPTDPDGGLGPDASGVPNPDTSDAGDAAPPGVVSYDTLTTTVHDCPGGLQPVDK
jgi:hypothetical protein